MHQRIQQNLICVLIDDNKYTYVNPNDMLNKVGIYLTEIKETKELLITIFVFQTIFAPPDNYICFSDNICTSLITINVFQTIFATTVLQTLCVTTVLNVYAIKDSMEMDIPATVC